MRRDGQVKTSDFYTGRAQIHGGDEEPGDLEYALPHEGVN